MTKKKKSILMICLLGFLLCTTQLLAAQEAASVDLTSEEKAWLSDHPVIRVGGSSQFKPAFILNPDGTHSGIYPDIYDLMGTRLGVRWVEKKRKPLIQIKPVLKPPPMNWEPRWKNCCPI